MVGVNAVYRFVELNRERPADWDSLHYALQRTRGELGGPAGAVYDGLASLVLGPPGSDVARLNRSVAVGTLLLVGLVVLLALLAPRRPRLPQLLFLAAVGFLLANKVWSPQYVLWLLPLAALARPRWRPFLAWQAAEAGLLFARFYFFVGLPGAPRPAGRRASTCTGSSARCVLRDLALLALCAAVVRDVLRPEVDVVRADGERRPGRRGARRRARPGPRAAVPA